MKSAFTNISEMNTAFGNLFGCCVKDGKITDYEKLNNQAKNLYDELEELKEDGFDILVKEPNSTKGRSGMIDAIGDILVFLYGLPHFLNVNYVTPKHETEVRLSKISQYEGNEKYELIYNDVKELIDQIISAIKHQESLEVISEHINNLDAEIHALSDYYKIDVDTMIDRITLSNMSKLCASVQERDATLKKYRDEGVDVYAKESPLKQENGEPYYVVYSSKEQEVNGKVYRAHKFLKCVKFFEPDLSDI